MEKHITLPAYSSLGPGLPGLNPEAGVTAKGKERERERRYSNRRDCTECPALTSVALEAVEIAARLATHNRDEAKDADRQDRDAGIKRVESGDADAQTENAEREKIAAKMAMLYTLRAQNEETKHRDAEIASRLQLPQMIKAADPLMQRARSYDTTRVTPSFTTSTNL